MNPRESQALSGLVLDLLLHPIGTGRNIREIYRQAFKEAKELYVLSAYLRTWDTTLKINSRCNAFAFIVGSDFGITRKQACRDVLKWLPAQMKPFFFVADEISGFRPKALFWRDQKGHCYSIIGSSNLSEAGWSTNYEANAFDKISATAFDLVKNWIADIRKHSKPISKEWIEAYEEATTSRKKKSHANTAPALPLATVELPTFHGQAQTIRERRNKKRAFAKIRPVLLSAIRRCAAGRIANSASIGYSKPHGERINPVFRDGDGRSGAKIAIFGRSAEGWLRFLRQRDDAT